MICSPIMKVLAATIFLVAVLFCTAGETNPPSTLEAYQLGLAQEPIGSTTSWTISTNSKNWIVYHMTNNTSGSNWIVYGGPVPISLPYTYRDTNCGICLRVETDARHITAMDSGGKALWYRDPFAEAHLEFYRTRTPRIRFMGRTSKRMENNWSKFGGTSFLEVLFNSSQFGFLDVHTGDFFFGGQD